MTAFSARRIHDVPRALRLFGGGLRIQVFGKRSVESVSTTRSPGISNGITTKPLGRRSGRTPTKYSQAASETLDAQ